MKRQTGFACVVTRARYIARARACFGRRVTLLHLLGRSYFTPEVNLRVVALHQFALRATAETTGKPRPLVSRRVLRRVDQVDEAES